MSIRVIPSTLVLATIALCLVAVTRAEDTKTGGANAIKSLMMERRDVLRERERLVQAEFNGGQTSINFVIACQNDAISAELELADSKEERVKFRKEMLDNMKKFERYAERNFDNGVGSMHEKLAATAARIAYEIALRREQNTQ